MLSAKHDSDADDAPELDLQDTRIGIPPPGRYFLRIYGHALGADIRGKQISAAGGFGDGLGMSFTAV